MPKQKQLVRECYRALGRASRDCKTAEARVERIATLLCRGALDSEIMPLFASSFDLINEITSQLIEAKCGLAEAFGGNGCHGETCAECKGLADEKDNG